MLVSQRMKYEGAKSFVSMETLHVSINFLYISLWFPDDKYTAPVWWLWLIGYFTDS